MVCVCYMTVLALQEYEVTLLENFQSGNVISQVTAKDEDSGELGEITYFFPDSEMSAPALWKEVVTLNNVTGEVQLLQNLDRERHDGLVYFFVKTFMDVRRLI